LVKVENSSAVLTAYTTFSGDGHITRSLTPRKSRDRLTKTNKPITLPFSKMFNSIVAEFKKGVSEEEITCLQFNR